jgi:hypothetical protein
MGGGNESKGCREFYADYITNNLFPDAMSGGTCPAIAGRKTCSDCKNAAHSKIRVLYTFMRAFESFPVHCLKFRPCGKRRRPG